MEAALASSPSDESDARAQLRRACAAAAWRRRLLPLGAGLLLIALWQLSVAVFLMSGRSSRRRRRRSR